MNLKENDWNSYNRKTYEFKTGDVVFVPSLGIITQVMEVPDNIRYPAIKKYCIGVFEDIQPNNNISYVEITEPILLKGFQ